MSPNSILLLDDVRVDALLLAPRVPKIVPSDMPLYDLYVYVVIFFLAYRFNFFYLIDVFLFILF